MGGTTLCFQPPFLWPQWSTSLRRLMPAYQGHPPEAGADEPNGRETARSNCHGSKPPNWGWFLRPISGNLGDGSTLLPPQPKLPSQIARFVPKTAVIQGRVSSTGCQHWHKNVGSPRPGRPRPAPDPEKSRPPSHLAAQTFGQFQWIFVWQNETKVRPPILW